MLDIWCKETADRSPLYPVGAFRREKIPEGVYGMIGALLLRSGSIGDEIQDELRHLHFPLPDSPFRIVLFSLEDTQITVLTGKEPSQLPPECLLCRDGAPVPPTGGFLQWFSGAAYGIYDRSFYIPGRRITFRMPAGMLWSTAATRWASLCTQMSVCLVVASTASNPHFKW